MRSLSFTEITTALTCQASWDFAYGGRLAGHALKRREVAPILSDGRAWGAAVAAWHSSEGSPFDASVAAHDAMTKSFDDELVEVVELGGTVQPLEARLDQRDRLEQIFAHYAGTVERFPNLTRLEGEIVVPLWSRSHRGHSNRYEFRCFIDGYTIEYLSRQWIVEFKLRTALQDAEQIMRNRQPRWYAWALRELGRSLSHGYELGGVIVDERLKEAPKPARLVKGRTKARPLVPSHSKDQLSTVESYQALCAEFEEEERFEVIQHLRDRRWQQRIPIPFRPSEMDEAGEELISAAKQIHQLDTGNFYPIRNAKPANCRSCDFRGICSEPHDRFLVDTQFERVEPKRSRKDEEK